MKQSRRFQFLMAIGSLTLSRPAFAQQKTPDPVAEAKLIEQAYFTLDLQPTGKGPVSLAALDLGVDGIPDVAVVNTESRTLSLFQGLGDGTFEHPDLEPLGEEPVAITAGDLNGDGRADLVVVNRESRTLTILLGRKDGRHHSRIQPLEGAAPVAAAIGDLNGDGQADVAIANYDDNDISQLFGDGEGYFTSFPRFSVGRGPRAIVIAPIDGDDRPDLAILNGKSNNVTLLCGAAAGDFQFYQNVLVGPGPVALALNHVDRDARLELITANWKVPSITICTPRKDFLTWGSSTIELDSRPAGLLSDDLNADGLADFAATLYETGSLELIVSNTERRKQREELHAEIYDERARYPVGPGAVSISSADFNGDGADDLIVATREARGFRVLLRNTPESRRLPNLPSQYRQNAAFGATGTP